MDLYSVSTKVVSETENIKYKYKIRTILGSGLFMKNAKNKTENKENKMLNEITVDNINRKRHKI